MRVFSIGTLIFFSTVARGQECTHLWDYHLETDPLRPKAYSGDSTAGYGVFSFWGNPNLKFEIRGKFPRARFLSYETQSTRLVFSEDSLFDHQIEPDSGSENPFREGVPIDTPYRDYTITMRQTKAEGATNTIRLPHGRLAQSVMLRIYAPNEGVQLSKADLPRIFAYHAETGQPAVCPRHATYPPRWYFPQFLADIYTNFHSFEFKLKGSTNILGLNKAISYMYAVTPMKATHVILIRFLAPSFDNTRPNVGAFPVGAQVRYWSFCNNNFPNNETLNCLPDYLAALDSDGFVTIAIGRGDEVKREALARGYSFLPDTRKARQRVMGFVYRNLGPTPDFKNTDMYQRDYTPNAILCEREDFLKGNCRL